MTTPERKMVPAAGSTSNQRPADDSASERRNPSSRKGGKPSSSNKKFAGKTDGMQGQIFDIGLLQSKRFIDTHEELVEYVAWEFKNGHAASRAIADLTLAHWWAEKSQSAGRIVREANIRFWVRLLRDFWWFFEYRSRCI